MINCSPGDAFGVSSCQFWNTVLQCTHLKLLDRVVSRACFLAGGVLNCDLSHHQSVAVLCMLYKIRCNPKHPLCGALPVPYVPVRVTHGAFITHRYTFAPPRCRTSQYRRTFIPLSVSLWNDLVDPYLMVWDQLVSRAGPMPFCWPSCSLLFCLQLFSLYLLFLYGLIVWGWVLQTDGVDLFLPPGLSLPSFFNNNNTYAPPRCTAGLLLPFQCCSGSILLTPYSMVWDWWVSRARPMPFYWRKLLSPYYSLLLFFPFSSSCL